MLKEILYRIQREEGLPELPRPCDVFDLAGGTGTGGYVVIFLSSTFKQLTSSSNRLIVIMLFRLRMSIDEAIEYYADLARHVFSVQKWYFQDGKFKASRLEDAIVTTIQKALNISEADARSAYMLDEEGPKWCGLPCSSIPTQMQQFRLCDASKRRQFSFSLSYLDLCCQSNLQLYYRRSGQSDKRRSYFLQKHRIWRTN